MQLKRAQANHDRVSGRYERWNHPLFECLLGRRPEVSE